MRPSCDFLLVAVMLLNFLALGTSRMRVCIQAAAVQGVLLGVLPLLVPQHVEWRTALVAAGTLLVKGLVIPSLLFKAMRDVKIRREVEPYLGFVPSLFLAGVGTGLALLFGGSLPLAPAHTGSLAVPASLATLLAGFLLLTTRRKAITQVVGYLILENGIFVFALLLLEAMPFIVEVGVLLDLFVAVFVMGIVLDHIRSEFSSLDTERLAELKE